ncbi:prepilin-type N-terminal cleavage/methylation domain-containing protein [Thermodesulfobacteriota bacterium]
MTLHKQSEGFTLLEVAVALAIISIVFVSLTSLFNTSLGIDDYSKKLTKATLLAQRVMTEKEIANDFPPGESSVVTLEGDYEGYRYRTVVTDTMYPLVQEVNLIVTFESVIKEHSITLTSYVIMSVGDILAGEEG